MKIRKLTSEVQAALRTGIIISDITQCISELVQNSLDAKATSIAVRLNLENFTLQVIDNGHGLSKEELDIIGQRYMTSKCHSMKDLQRGLSYYGFRGEALASIRESCAVLMIISKTKECEQTYSKVFRAGKESHNAIVSTHNRLCVGTTVVVKDFLHNLPVRRARIQPVIEIECVRHSLISLSIINYKVSFTLRNDVTKAIILQTQEFRSSEDALSYHCDLKESHNFIETSSNDPRFKINALISKETEAYSSFQFIYVNGRLVKNKRVYELINKHLSKSFSMRNIGKGVKGIDDVSKEKTYPVFIIHIQCSFSEYEIVSDPKKLKVEFKRWDCLEKSIEKVIDQFVLSDNTLFCVDSDSSNNIDKMKVDNLDAAKTANHINHIVKSNVLCSKPVSRQISDIDHSKVNSGNVCETYIGVLTPTSSDKRKDPVTNKSPQKSLILKPVKGLSHKTKPKEVESRMDHLKPSCKDKYNRLQHQSVGQHQIVSIKKLSFEKKFNLEHNGSRTMVTKTSSLVSAETVLTRCREKDKCHNRVLQYKSDTNTQKNNSTLESELSDSFCFKTPKAVNPYIKRKKFTEHILTESETDISPVKKMCYPQKEKNKYKSEVESMRTCKGLKKNDFSERILTATESNTSFKAPQWNHLVLKNNSLKEHILTESESNTACTNFLGCTNSKSYDQKSILPITSHDFFNDAIKNFCETQFIHYYLNETSNKQQPRKALQVKMSRSLKRIPHTNALQLSQKNTLSVISSSKSHTKISNKSILRTKKSQSINLESKPQNNLRQKKEFPNISKNGMHSFKTENTCFKMNLNKTNVNGFKASHYWKLFSPAFAKVKSTRSYKPTLQSNNYRKSLKSKLLSKKTPIQIKHTGTSVSNVNPNLQVVSSVADENYTFNGCLLPKSILKRGKGKCMNKEKNPKPVLKISVVKNHCTSKTNALRNNTNFQKDFELIFCRKNKYKSQNFSSDIDHLCNGQKNSSTDEINPRYKYHPDIKENLLQHRTKPSPVYNYWSSPILTCFDSRQQNTSNNGQGKNTSPIFSYLPSPILPCFDSRQQNTSNNGQGKNPSPVYSYLPSPILPCFDSRQQNTINNVQAKIQTSMHFEKLHSCGVLPKFPLISPNRNLNLHPSEKKLNFDHFNLMNKNCSNLSSIKGGQVFKLKHVSNDDYSNFTNFHFQCMPNIHLSKENYQYDCVDKGLTSKIGISETPINNKGGLNGKECLKNTNVLYTHKDTSVNANPPNSLVETFQKDFFDFESELKSIPEILKQSNETPDNQISNFKFDNFENVAEKDLKVASQTHCANYNKSDYPRKLKKDSKIASVKPTFNDNENNHECLKSNSDILSKCHNISKKSSESPNHKNIILRNSLFGDINLEQVEDNSKTCFINKAISREEALSCKINVQNNECVKDNLDWSKEITSSGKVFYINRLTGMSYFSTPQASNNNSSFVIEGRYWFMPKGVSPILNIGGDAKSTTRKLTKTENDVIDNILCANKVELKRIKWREGFDKENPVAAADAFMNIFSETGNSRSWQKPPVDYLKSCVFSSKSLVHAQVLGQVDKKFIAALLQPNEGINTFLVLFDQHAVDERIRVESLKLGYKKSDEKLERHELNFAIKLQLSELESALIKELLPRISNLGLNLIIQDEKVEVTEVPLCVFNRYTREGENREWLRDTVMVLVKQLLQSAQDSCGVIPSMPSLLSDLINSEACRGSIKFGDILTLDLCRLLISKLATCEVPFQCAHGRPALAPLIEVKSVENVTESINLKRLSTRIQSKGIPEPCEVSLE